MELQTILNNLEIESFFDSKDELIRGADYELKMIMGNPQGTYIGLAKTSEGEFYLFGFEGKQKNKGKFVQLEYVPKRFIVITGEEVDLEPIRHLENYNRGIRCYEEGMKLNKWTYFQDPSVYHEAKKLVTEAKTIDAEFEVLI